MSNHVTDRWRSSPFLYLCTHSFLDRKHIFLGPIPRVSDSPGLEWNFRICISNFPGDVNDAVLGTTTLRSSVLGHFQVAFFKYKSMFLPAIKKYSQHQLKYVHSFFIKRDDTQSEHYVPLVSIPHLAALPGITSTW